MRWYKDRPEEGDLVVVTISDVDKNSAYAELDEYEDIRGLVHISEISRSWVQDASKELSEGEKTVAQVIDADDDGSLDLSLKRVNDKQKKDAMSRWNREQKAEKFLEQLTDKLDEEKDELYDEIIFPLQKKLGSSFEGFEIAVGKEEKLKDILDKDKVEAIKEVARKNINLKQEKLEGEIEVRFQQGDGIERIKEVFEDLEDAVDIKYISAPKYEVTAWGRNPELAKKRMDNTVERVREKTEELDGEFEFSKA